eukprot:3150045-Prymnesium_polylepis.1
MGTWSRGVSHVGCVTRLDGHVDGVAGGGGGPFDLLEGATLLDRYADQRDRSSAEEGHLAY